MSDGDHIHAHFGTFVDLAAEARFTELIDAAEAFNGGSPFTLCRCPPLGRDEINLTASVRQRLCEGQWIPEAGVARLSLSAPADGRMFALDMRLPRDQGHRVDVHIRMGLSYFAAEQLAETRAYLEALAQSLRIEFGYVHDARDENIQNTRDPSRYRALTGEIAALDDDARVDPALQPGRSSRAGQQVISCRWMNLFGESLAAQIGHQRLRSAPCDVQALEHGGFVLTLYPDPLAFAAPENREVQAAVRQHLRLDELADAARWHAVERVPAVDFATQRKAVNDQPGTTAERPAPEAPDPTPASADPAVPSLDLSIWAQLYDPNREGQPGEVDLYTAQARAAAGRVLQIGCGPGRIAMAVAGTGVPVVGLDPSVEIINHIRRCLKRQPPAIQSRTTLLLGDLSHPELERHAPFSAAFIPYRGVNRLCGGALREHLARVYELLLPGGALIFNTFFPRVYRWPARGRSSPVLRHSGIDPASQTPFRLFDTIESDIVSQQLTVTRQLIELDGSGEVTTQRFFEIQLAYFFPNELRYLLELVGFRPRIVGGFQQQPLRRASQEIVVIAQKGG